MLSLYKFSFIYAPESEARARVGVGDVRITNGDKTTVISAQVLNNYVVNSNIYIFRKFVPTPLYIAAVFWICAGAFM